MGVMRTLMLAGAAALAAGAAAADQPYKSDQHRFSLNAPTGWTLEPDTTNETIRLRVRANANARVFCNISTVDRPTLKDIPQAEIDTALTPSAGEALVRRDVAGIEGATVESLTVSIVQKGGHPALSSDMVLAAGSGPFRVRRLDLFRPGLQYIVSCGGPAADAQPLAPQFETILNSFRLN